MAFLDKVFGNDKEQKLQEEINSLKLRKESVFSTINNEINQLENTRNHIFQQAGMTSYKAWSEGTSQMTSLDNYWNQVKEIENKIAEQEAKKKEMGARYDEEISLISNNLTDYQAETGALKKCPKCGAVASGADMFCQKCGEKLEQSAAAQMIREGRCPNCGAENDEGSVFCIACGTKLK